MALALGLGLLACGGSTKHSAADPYGPGNTTVTAYFPHHTADRDGDTDHNDDDDVNLDYGHAPSRAERTEMVSLVRNYYSAAVAENGAKACALLAPFLAESVAEEYGHTVGVSGRTCATVVSKIFKLRHAELVVKNATLKLPDMRAEGDKGIAILEFPAIAEVRKVNERRVNGKWRMLNVLDTIIE
jgi:hypothetical protein